MYLFKIKKINLNAILIGILVYYYVYLSTANIFIGNLSMPVMPFYWISLVHRICIGTHMKLGSMPTRLLILNVPVHWLTVIYFFFDWVTVFVLFILQVLRTNSSLVSVVSNLFPFLAYDLSNVLFPAKAISLVNRLQNNND